MNAPEQIRTARLLLRKARREDAPLMFAAYAQDPEVTRYLLWRPHADVSESYAAIDRFLAAWDAQSEFVWLIFKDRTELIGSIAARKQEDAFNLGYLLARPFWGRAYMPEAIRAVVDWAFTNPSISQVWAECDLENRASARALEKSGFVREGVLSQFQIFPNLSPTPRDCYRYVLLRRLLPPSADVRRPTAAEMSGEMESAGGENS
ncbi:MAG TPA: GNAT family N-acetyltransferase [Chthoniobacterales bacterium]|nr:GNAT family N-acetyltransferase [Chthoniobacterales bacterium]